MGDLGTPANARPTRLASAALSNENDRPAKRARIVLPIQKVHFTRSKAREASKAEAKPQLDGDAKTEALKMVRRPDMESSAAATIPMSLTSMPTTITATATPSTTPSSVPSSPATDIDQGRDIILKRPRGQDTETIPLVNGHGGDPTNCEISFLSGPSTASTSVATRRSRRSRPSIRFNWAALPYELRQRIIECLVDLYRSPKPPKEKLAPYATVCRQFQEVIERHLFSTVMVSPRKLRDFDGALAPSRRRYIKRVEIIVSVPSYFNDPCRDKETITEKRQNNKVFTEIIYHVFRVMAQWPDEEIRHAGIMLTLLVSSVSDLRNANFELWQRRRWDSEDIGEKRFTDSVIDFLGQDDLHRYNSLPTVYAVTSFATHDLTRRAISPCAYSDIVSRLPRLRFVRLGLHKDKRVVSRKAMFDNVAAMMPHWPMMLDFLDLSASTIASWREIPHATVAEKDSGRLLGAALLQFASQLRALRLRNVVAMRDLLRAVWPLGEDAHHIVDLRLDPRAPTPEVPLFWRLETVHITYGTLSWNVAWRNPNNEPLQNEESLYCWRQTLSMALGTLAQKMPCLRHMVVAQRPFMWAGKFCVTLKVAPRQTFGNFKMALVRHAPIWANHAQWRSIPPNNIAVVAWQATSVFNPLPEVLESWSMFAAGRELELRYTSIQENGWRMDGAPPVEPSMHF